MPRYYTKEAQRILEAKAQLHKGKKQSLEVESIWLDR